MGTKIKIDGSTNKDDFFNFLLKLKRGAEIQMRVDDGEVYLEVM